MKVKSIMNRCMKITNITVLTALLAVGFWVSCGGYVSGQGAPTPPEGAPRVYLPQPPETLTKFDLDFKGGHPQDLVAAIQKAAGKPLNVLIPDEYANVTLPELKMKNVNASQLFRALEQASHKTEYLKNSGNNTYSAHGTAFGFRANSDNTTDDTIWYFYVLKPNVPPPYKICRFYSLAPYLDSGVTVDDITTAIKTGAKMLGDTDEPTMSFHKDTKLLIAVGEPGKLEIIDSVLRALEPDSKSTAGDKSGPSAKPAAKSGQEK
jgi:hypothetical protein